MYNIDFKILKTLLALAKDVAEWIEYDKNKSSRLVDVVDEEEKVRHNVSTLGGILNTWFLTEDGLYEVLMQSRKYFILINIKLVPIYILGMVTNVDHTYVHSLRSCP